MDRGAACKSLSSQTTAEVVCSGGHRLSLHGGPVTGIFQGHRRVMSRTLRARRSFLGQLTDLSDGFRSCFAGHDVTGSQVLGPVGVRWRRPLAPGIVETQAAVPLKLRRQSSIGSRQVLRVETRALDRRGKVFRWRAYGISVPVLWQARFANRPAHCLH